MGYTPGTMVLLAGTARGLFVLSSTDRKRWQVDRQSLQGRQVYHAVIDRRTENRMFAAENDAFFGCFLKYSDDFGETWQEPKEGIRFPEGGEHKLKNIWLIEPGRPDEPETIYAGIDPANLWESHDAGETWEVNEALLQHPTRERWWPGNGGLCLHSIVADPSDPDRMWVGISAVGCMRTTDGGKTWTHMNRGTRAEFHPERFPEFGQCLHHLIQHPTRPDVLYQQNHCGVYRSDDAAESWTEISEGLPSDFGFPMALDPHHPETIFTVPLDGNGRHNMGDQFAVYRSQDAGESWQELTNGLPAGKGVKLGVLRQAMCSDMHDPCGVYVGTNTGQIFATADRGESWELIADFLPRIHALTVVQL